MYILTTNSVKKSAKCLANKIVTLGGPKLRVETEPIDDSLFVRWGTSQMCSGVDTVFNSPLIIRQVVNKHLLSVELLKYRIPHVELFSGIPDNFPVVVRKRLSGSGGDGIVICKNMEEFLPLQEYMWSYWVNFRFELGVHVLDGSIIKVFKKVSSLDEESEFPIKNSDNGYSFSLCRIESFKRLPEIVNTIISAVPIKFCRMDIGWDKDDGVYKLIEINSAPGLAENDSTLTMYAEFLMRNIL